MGQTQNIPDRMGGHQGHKEAIRGRPCLQKTAVARHRHSGQRQLNPDNHVVAYRSAILSRRLMIETALITLCNTVDHTKASSNVTDMDTLGPILLGASNINWKAVSKVQPKLNPLYVPKRHLGLFRNQPSSPENDGLPPEELPDPLTSFSPEPRYNFRPRVESDSNNLP